MKIGQTVAEIWRFNGFQNGGRSLSWIYWARIWSGTIHDDYLVVSIMKNLVEIEALVSITVASRPLGQVEPWPDLSSARWGQVSPGSAARTKLY